MQLGCIFVVDNHRMKRALYFLLMVWIALQSTFVQMSDIAVTDAEQEESCTMVMCSHPVGAFYSSSQLCWGQLSGTPPSTVLPLESAHALDDIERPKWPLAAPGVAGI